MPRAFISYAKEDYVYARAVKIWLEDPNREVHPNRKWKAFSFEFDMNVGPWEGQLRREIPGSDLVVVMFSKRWFASPMCIEELTLAREHGVPVVVLLLPDATAEEIENRWLKDQQAFELSNVGVTTVGGTVSVSVPLSGRSQTVELSSHALSKLTGFLDQLAPPDPTYFPLPADVTEPYPGPRPLRVEEAGIFFGRDDEIRTCLQHIRYMTSEKDAGALIIDAPSGGGKSSFLRAGILARLQKLRADFYVLPPITITQKPVSDPGGLRAALKMVLSDLSIQTPVANYMRADNIDLAHELRIGVTRKCGRPLPIVISVDQGEELLMDAGGEGASERLLFWQVLKNVLASGKNIFLVTTVRQELYHDFVRHLPSEFRPERFPLQPLTKDRYEEIIERPLDRPEFGERKLDAALIELLVRDVLNPKLRNPLPLLAFTLQRLWDTTTDNPIRAMHYKGLAHSLVQATDQAIDQLAGNLFGKVADTYDERRAKTLKELSNFLFRHFISVDQHKNPISRREYKENFSGRYAEEILKSLRASRIVVEGYRAGGDVGGDTNEPYELAHEGLIDEWEWLKAELESRKEDFILRARLENSASIWIAEREDPGSAVLGRGDWNKVVEISAGDVSKFSEMFEAKTGAKIEKFIQRFVVACEAADAGKRAEADKRVAAVRKQARGWMILSLVVAAALGYSIWREYDRIKGIELAAAAQAAEAADVERRTAEAEIARIDALRDGAQGCWSAQARPTSGGCWNFTITQDVSGNLAFTCVGDSPESIALRGDSLVRDGGESLTPIGGALIGQRDGAVVNHYKRCDAETQAEIQQYLQARAQLRAASNR